MFPTLAIAITPPLIPSITARGEGVSFENW